MTSTLAGRDPIPPDGTCDWNIGTRKSTLPHVIDKVVTCNLPTCLESVKFGHDKVEEIALAEATNLMMGLAKRAAVGETIGENTCPLKRDKFPLRRNLRNSSHFGRTLVAENRQLLAAAVAAQRQIGPARTEDDSPRQRVSPGPAEDLPRHL